MWITVKTNYGQDKGGYASLKTPSDPPFEIDDAKGEELIERDIAEEATGKVAAAKPKTNEIVGSGQSWKTRLTKMNKPELLELAVEKGLPATDGDTKTAIIAMLLPVMEADGKPETEDEGQG